MKIHILYQFSEGPWGGGNQFLKALRSYFRKTGVYSESPAEAEVILFNSHQSIEEVCRVKGENPSKILIHRIDGPISYIRGKDKLVDEIIFQSNSILADGTIFQSSWSRENNYEMGMREPRYETIIMNAPDPTIFTPEDKKPFGKDKIKLITTSWSSNTLKGFDIYKFLDEHLDFSKYEMTFVGNSPIEFKNIKMIKPVPSQRVAELLREHDIFIIASRNDPCSNSLIEALNCGLPVVAMNDGGHPEIVRQAGQLFQDINGIMDAIGEITRNYKHYQASIDLPTFDEVAGKYYEFAQSVYEDYLNGNYYPKKITSLGIVTIKTKLVKRAILNNLQNLLRS